MTPHPPSLRRAALVLATLGAAAVSACGESQAMGDVTSIIVGADPELWAQVEDTLETALEPRIRTVRDERTFQVTHQDPTGTDWGNLRKFRQLLLIGTGDEPWMQDAVRKLDERPTPPAVVQVGDVWARGQGVTLLLVPEGGEAAAVASEVAQLNAMYDRQFRDYASNRMFMSGADSALADTLASELGFRLLVPTVYDWARRDSVVIFRNDNPDPAELIRQIAVTWRTPIPAGLQPEDLLAWRAAVADTFYNDAQVANLDVVEAGPFRYRDSDAYQIQAQWDNAPGADWPAGGPFILRSVVCRAQDRMYLLDAWLYAPGKEKYEYMIQLQTILDSFRCGDPAPGRGVGTGGASAPAPGPRRAPTDSAGGG